MDPTIQAVLDLARKMGLPEASLAGLGNMIARNPFVVNRAAVDSALANPADLQQMQRMAATFNVPMGFVKQIPALWDSALKSTAAPAAPQPQQAQQPAQALPPMRRPQVGAPIMATRLWECGLADGRKFYVESKIMEDGAVVIALAGPDRQLLCEPKYVHSLSTVEAEVEKTLKDYVMAQLTPVWNPPLNVSKSMDPQRDDYGEDLSVRLKPDTMGELDMHQVYRQAAAKKRGRPQ